ncbi:unnamed protein product [Hyaloperonospora brassicae]|uniref:Uncharacterized protein n=1 Tax=Hyaloperonospora brassicae TaxID=162125 RepID=A0AAV0UMD1_HYABA|nr:unnamed protein product [Hyaloperonospora brassicae]
MPIELHGTGAAVLRSFLATHLSAAQLERPDVKEMLHLMPMEHTNALSVAELRQVAALLRELRADVPSTPSLVSLLRQGKGVRARVVATEKDEEQQKAEQEKEEKRRRYLCKRRKALQRLDEDMRYDSMVSNVNPVSNRREWTKYETNVRQHLSIGANMVMARITAFGAVYFVARNVTDNETMRLVAGLGGAIVMMVIEMVLFIARAAKMEQLEKKLKSRF